MSSEAPPTWEQFDALYARIERLLAEVARLEQAVGEVTRERAAVGLRLHRAEAALAVAREREQRAVKERDEFSLKYSRAGNDAAEASEREQLLHDYLADVASCTPHKRGCDEPDDPSCAACIAAAGLAAHAALVDEPAAAGAGHNLCACGSTLIVCAKCGDSRCLVCDPYDELDTCGATEPAAATLAEPREAGEGDTRGSTSPVGPLRDGRGSASAAADEPGETPT